MILLLDSNSHMNGTKRLQGTFSDDLKRKLGTTTIISKTPQMIQTPQGLKEMFISDKKKEVNNIFNSRQNKHLLTFFYMTELKTS